MPLGPGLRVIGGAMNLPRRSTRTLPLVPALVLAGALSSPLPASALFQRGDADASGSLDLTDAVRILAYLFLGAGPDALPCLDAADADDSGKLDLADPILLLDHLFRGGKPLPRPFSACGSDPTGDALLCASYAPCPGAVEELLGTAEAVVFIIDRSGTMQDQGELAVAKREALDAACAFREDGELGVVFFDKGMLRFPAAGPPLAASDDFKAEVVRFVASVAGGSGSCPQIGLVAALEMLGLSAKKDRAIVYLSDGTATCPGSSDEAAYIRHVLEVVQQLNADGLPIHAVGIGRLAPLYQKFLEDLAAQTGGK
ncbi:MAG: hypothetical protein HY721_15050, partial [Planctomycetes bacterium]|nr:hypothetical protein [Planctomycetota bacterium]